MSAASSNLMIWRWKPLQRQSRTPESTARDIDLILDYSTFPGDISQSLSFAHKLSAELGADDFIES